MKISSLLRQAAESLRTDIRRHLLGAAIMLAIGALLPLAGLPLVPGAQVFLLIFALMVVALLLGRAAAVSAGILGTLIGGLFLTPPGMHPLVAALILLPLPAVGWFLVDSFAAFRQAMVLALEASAREREMRGLPPRATPSWAGPSPASLASGPAPRGRRAADGRFEVPDTLTRWPAELRPEPIRLVPKKPPPYRPPHRR